MVLKNIEIFVRIYDDHGDLIKLDRTIAMPVCLIPGEEGTFKSITRYIRKIRTYNTHANWKEGNWRCF